MYSQKKESLPAMLYQKVVAVQLSGWIRTVPLFTGGIDDSAYIDKAKY